jgi:hypothetical protein
LSLRVTVKRILSFGKRDVTNAPQVKLHRIIVKIICHFVSQMILYLGPLLQCRKLLNLKLMHFSVAERFLLICFTNSWQPLSGIQLLT